MASISLAEKMRKPMRLSLSFSCVREGYRKQESIHLGDLSNRHYRQTCDKIQVNPLIFLKYAIQFPTLRRAVDLGSASMSFDIQYHRSVAFDGTGMIETVGEL